MESLDEVKSWSLDIDSILKSPRKVRGKFHTPKVDKDNELIQSEAVANAVPDFMHLPILHDFHKERPIGIATRVIQLSDGSFDFEGVIKSTPDADDIWDKIITGNYNQVSLFGSRKSGSSACKMQPGQRTSPCQTTAIRLDSISACDENARNDGTSLEVAKAGSKVVFVATDTIIKAETSNSSLMHSVTDSPRKCPCRKSANPATDQKLPRAKPENKLRDYLKGLRDAAPVPEYERKASSSVREWARGFQTKNNRDQFTMDTTAPMVEKSDPWDHKNDNGTPHRMNLNDTKPVSRVTGSTYNPKTHYEDGSEVGKGENMDEEQKGAAEDEFKRLSERPGEAGKQFRAQNERIGIDGHENERFYEKHPQFKKGAEDIESKIDRLTAVVEKMVGMDQGEEQKGNYAMRGDPVSNVTPEAEQERLARMHFAGKDAAARQAGTGAYSEQSQQRKRDFVHGTGASKLSADSVGSTQSLDRKAEVRIPPSDADQKTSGIREAQPGDKKAEKAESLQEDAQPAIDKNELGQTPEGGSPEPAEQEINEPADEESSEEIPEIEQKLDRLLSAVERLVGSDANVHQEMDEEKARPTITEEPATGGSTTQASNPDILGPSEQSRMKVVDRDPRSESRNILASRGGSIRKAGTETMNDDEVNALVKAKVEAQVTDIIKASQVKIADLEARLAKMENEPISKAAPVIIASELPQEFGVAPRSNAAAIAGAEKYARKV